MDVQVATVGRYPGYQTASRNGHLQRTLIGDILYGWYSVDCFRYFVELCRSTDSVVFSYQPDHIASRHHGLFDDDSGYVGPGGRIDLCWG